MSWQKKLAQGFTSATDLLAYLQITTEACALAQKQFPLRVPLAFANRMQKGNPRDPLLLQVLAVKEENNTVSGYISDPLQESTSNPLKGLIHKYQGRVLLTLTGACAINCRYCFRRHFPYEENNPGRKGWEAVYAYIANDESISEVILSGGDPLLAPDLLLQQVIDALEKIPHVETLRIHSRIPIVFPERIDEALLALLAKTRLKKVLVLHCNHPQELDAEVARVCVQLKDVGCYLLNQTVLLAGVNDNADVLAQLSRSLFDIGILPYYLHLLDKVQGAAHFDLSCDEAKILYASLQQRLPGYLVPRLVREEPGKANKTLVI